MKTALLVIVLASLAGLVVIGSAPLTVRGSREGLPHGAGLGSSRESRR